MTGMEWKGRSRSDLKQGCNRFIMEKITFALADDQIGEFYVLEQTRTRRHQLYSGDRF